MGLYDNRRSNISKQSAQSKALKRQKAVERRERRQTEGPQFEVAGTHVIIFITAVLTAAYFAGLLPDP